MYVLPHPPRSHPAIDLLFPFPFPRLGCNNSVTEKATVPTPSRPQTSLSSYSSSPLVLSSAPFWPLLGVICLVVDGVRTVSPLSHGSRLTPSISIVASCLVFSLGVALQSVDMVSCLVPMYQSECSPKWVRGAVVSVSSPSCSTSPPPPHSTKPSLKSVTNGPSPCSLHASMKPPTTILYIAGFAAPHVRLRQRHDGSPPSPYSHARQLRRSGNRCHFLPHERVRPCAGHRAMS
jgi:hypothetical protein